MYNTSKYNTVNTTPYNAPKLIFGTTTLISGKILSYDVSRCCWYIQQSQNIHALNRFKSSYGIEIRRDNCAPAKKNLRGSTAQLQTMGQGEDFLALTFYIFTQYCHCLFSFDWWALPNLFQKCCFTACYDMRPSYYFLWSIYGGPRGETGLCFPLKVERFSVLWTVASWGYLSNCVPK